MILSPLKKLLLSKEKQPDLLEIMCLSYCRNTRTIKGATNYFGEPIHYWANRKLDQYAWDELVAHSRMNEPDTHISRMMGTQIDFVLPNGMVYHSTPLFETSFGVDLF